MARSKGSSGPPSDDPGPTEDQGDTEAEDVSDEALEPSEGSEEIEDESDDGDEDQGVFTPPPRGAGFKALQTTLSQTFLKPNSKTGRGARDASAPMTEAEKKDWIRSLEPQEQRFGYIAAALAFILTLTILPFVLSNHYVKETAKVHGHVVYESTQTTYTLLFLLQLALVVVMVLATRYQKRSLLAFAAFFTGLVAGSHTTVILGLPFIVFGGWLILRSWRVQRYGTTSAKGSAAVAQQKREAKIQGRASGRSTKEVKSKSPTASSRPAPAPSKRYTPKTPKKKRPQPSPE